MSEENCPVCGEKVKEIEVHHKEATIPVADGDREWCIRVRKGNKRGVEIYFHGDDIREDERQRILDPIEERMEELKYQIDSHGDSLEEECRAWNNEVRIRQLKSLKSKIEGGENEG